MKSYLIKIFLLLWLMGSMTAFILHFFFYNLVSEFSLWNISMGWQREIALWNISIGFIIIYVLIHDKYSLLINMVKVLSLFSFVLGANHLITQLVADQLGKIHIMGSILNFSMVVFGIYLIRKNDRK